MNTKLSAAVHGVLLAALGAPFAAHAQQSSPAANPADPAAPVPALVYVSVFQHAPRTADAGQTPDKVWRAANDALIAAPEHGGHGAPQAAQQATPQPAAAHANHHHRSQAEQ